MRNTIVASFLLLSLCPLFGGCVAAAAAGVGGAIASQELVDNNSYVSHINLDVKKVWPTVKTFLSDASLELIEVDDEVRLAKAKIDGANVTVSVEAYDIDKSIMRVSAKKYGFNDGELARIIMERIHRRLE